ncbi:MAG TPA: Ig-like domain-containing protein [Chloroflexota bacterium]|nr:Ig-like domain-containing protein [Chloroflexota bacterium]
MHRFASRVPWLVGVVALGSAAAILLGASTQPPAQNGAASTPTLIGASNQRSSSQPTIPAGALSTMTGLSNFNQLLTSLPTAMTIPGGVPALPTSLATTPLPTGSGAAITPTTGGLAPSLQLTTPTAPIPITPTPAVGSVTTATAEPVHYATMTPPTDPVVSIDTVNDGETISNGEPMTIGGWAVDPRGVGTSITAVDVFLDGGPGSGRYLGAADYGTTRPDVAGIFQHPDWTASGFAFEWTPRGIRAGDHTLVIVAQSAFGAPVTTEVSVKVAGSGGS